MGPLAAGAGRRRFAEFERSAGGRLLAHERRRRFTNEGRARRSGPERPGRSGSIRICVGIERVRPPRSWSDAGLIRGQGRFGDVGVRRRRAAGAIAKPVLNVLAELLQLRFEPALRVLQFLDPPVGLAELFLEPVDANHQPRGVIRVARARNVRRRRGLPVEEIELRLSRRSKRQAYDERRDEARPKR